MDPEAMAATSFDGQSLSSLSLLINWGSAFAMMIGGVVPYIPQYREIQVSDNADGFSLHVCLALLVANCLRILFWFGHPFELPLLFQSIIMVFAIFMLIHLCVRVKHRTQIVRGRDRHFSGGCNVDDGGAQLGGKGISPHSLAPSSNHFFFDFDNRYFWAWTDFTSYVEFTVTFVTILGVMTYVLLDNYWFVEGTGFAAVFVEAMLGMPQFCRNYRSQSTDGMSKKMVLMWLCGDIFKTGYFYVRNSPAQFYVCGALQVTVDVAILLQVLAYKGRTKPSTYVS